MKRLDRKFVRLSLCLGLTGAALAGCGPSRPAEPGADLAPLPTGEEIIDRAAEARKLALQFELTAGELHVAPLTRQRPALRLAFAQLAELLPRLAGPIRSGVFSHQYAVVVQTRDQLNNRPERLSDEALVDNGLQAAYNALRDLSYNQFYADEDLGKRLDTLTAAVNRLPQSTGADHAILTSDAVTSMSAVLTKMAGTLYDRNAEVGAPETVPATPEPAPPETPTTPPDVGPTPATPEPAPAPPANP